MTRKHEVDPNTLSDLLIYPARGENHLVGAFITRWAEHPEAIRIAKEVPPEEVDTFLPAPAAKAYRKNQAPSKLHRLMPAILSHEQVHRTLEKLGQREGKKGIHVPAMYSVFLERLIPYNERRYPTVAEFQHQRRLRR